MGFSVPGQPQNTAPRGAPVATSRAGGYAAPPPANRKPPLHPPHRLNLSSMKQEEKKSSCHRNLSRHIWSTATPTRSQIRKS